MKANKAPEKIYVDSNAIGENISTTVDTKRQDYPTCTEYIRTDAFIEKVENYLKNQFIKDVSVLAGGVVSINFETAINNFINYMKGE